MTKTWIIDNAVAPAAAMVISVLLWTVVLHDIHTSLSRASHVFIIL